MYLFQIVECFPHTMPKDLPELIQKSKWSKPAKEVETWDHWWTMHQKILKPLQKTAKIINNWWGFTGRNFSKNVVSMNYVWRRQKLMGFQESLWVNVIPILITRHFQHF